MPADYLSRLPASNTEPVNAAFDPFQTNLPELQREESYIKNILYFHKNRKWPETVSRTKANSLTDLVKRMFHDKDQILWVRLMDYKIPQKGVTPTQDVSERGPL
jgi:hypothetical protein